uniref:Uncharacterized protein n=1 Tax=Arundo donax TaxID=35708 RepID=A0A0A8YWR0_ARUDO
MIFSFRNMKISLTSDASIVMCAPSQ